LPVRAACVVHDEIPTGILSPRAGPGKPEHAQRRRYRLLGDEVVVEIEKLGRLTNVLIEEK